MIEDVAMKRILAGVVAASLSLAAPAFAASTINTNVPATSAPMASAPIRDNFVAAATDINNIEGMFATTNCSSILNPSVGQDCLNVGTAPAVWSKWTGSTGGWAIVGSINLTTGVASLSLNSSNLNVTTPITALFSAGIATVACPTCATTLTPSGAALTAANDTNVTLTLGGSPSNSLLNASSITAGWTGTLAAGRLNSNVVQGVTNDTNITGSIAAQNLTFAWAGTLAAGRLNSNVVQSFVNDTNVTATIASQIATLGWTGTLSVGRGGIGVGSLAANAFLTGNGTSAINAVAITGLVLGNGTSAPAAYGGVSCTNQALTALSAAGAATCTSITNSFLTAGTFSNITGVGTIGAGVWQGTVVAGLYGGTGLSTAAIGDIMYASATTPTWARLADVATGSVLVSGGVSTAPAWSASPILTTSLTVPSVIGGTSAGSSLTLESTSSGSPSGDSVVVKTGGATTWTIASNGNLSWGTVANACATYSVANCISSLNSATSVWFLGQDATHAFQFNWNYNATPASATATIDTFGYNNPLSIDGSTLSLQTNSGDPLYATLAADTGKTDATVCRDTTNGQLYHGTGTLGICLGTSGRQFKTAFKPMGTVLNRFANLDLWTYRYRPGYGDDGARRQYGPTAQDVAKVFPDLVRYDKNGTAINYDSGGLLLMSLRAIQELKADNDNLRRKFEEFEHFKRKQ